MTRKERDKMALGLAEAYLSGAEDSRTREEVLAGVRFALGAECPPWWAEEAFELRAIRREYREDSA